MDEKVERNFLLKFQTKRPSIYQVSSITLILSFFLMPLVLILISGHQLNFNFDGILLVILKNAILQSACSGFLVCFFGYYFGQKLAQYPCSRFSDILFRLVLVAPSLLPSLLVLVSALGFFQTLPNGLGAVVFCHSFIHVGFSSILWEIWVRQKAMNSMVLGQAIGLSWFDMHLKILLPQLKPYFFKSFFLWFVVFFASFEIPFFLGGLSYSGVEVYLYEQIFWLSDWGKAISFSILLFCFWLCIAFFLPKNSFPKMTNVGMWGWSSYSWKSFGFLLPSLFIFLGLFLGALKSIDGVFPIQEIKNSLGLALSVGWSLFFIFSLILFWDPPKIVLQFIFFSVPPSSVLLVFGIFLFPGNHSLVMVIKALIAFSLIHLPYLFRVGFLQTRFMLQDQKRMAVAMGLNQKDRFLWVLFPQSFSVLLILSGLGAMWTVGDFMISGFFFSETPFLGSLLQFYLSSYQFDSAQAMAFPTILVCFLICLCFAGAYVVADKKNL